MDTVQIGGTPHVRKKRTIRGIMLDVLIALLPATAAGIVYFGWRAVFTIALCLVCSFATEVVWLLCKKMKWKEIFAQFDCTSLVTGLLLALCMPAVEYKYWYVPVLASVFSIAVVKMLFGGTGRNIVNPAVTGRVFAFISFQSVMVSGWMTPLFGPLDSNVVVSGTTPLTAMLKDGLNAVDISQLDLFLGTGVMGSIGEICKVALLVGFVYLVVRRVVKWQWPVLYIAVTGLISCAMGGSMDYFVPSILSGGLLLGAIFMATDYVTSPSNTVACYVYYILLGVVTALLRFGTGIEVVSFAILLMNLLVPLFNTYLRPRPFGAKPIKEVIRDKFAAINAKKGKKEDAQ